MFDWSGRDANWVMSNQLQSGLNISIATPSLLAFDAKCPKWLKGV